MTLIARVNLRPRERLFSGREQTSAAANTRIRRDRRPGPGAERTGTALQLRHRRLLGAAINNAAITAPINEITMVSAADSTLAVPSTITAGVGNFAVGWDTAA